MTSEYSEANGREGERSAQNDPRAQLTRLDTEVRQVVERRPLAAIAGAVLLGFLVGRLIGR